MMRCYADNVLLELEPLPTMSEGGLLHLPQQTRAGARGSRFAKVLSSGPGHYRQLQGGAGSTVDGGFVPNETKPGDRVLVDAQAGNNWDADLSAPRHNRDTTFGEYRVVREAEILAIVVD